MVPPLHLGPTMARTRQDPGKPGGPTQGYNGSHCVTRKAGPLPQHLRASPQRGGHATDKRRAEHHRSASLFNRPSGAEPAARLRGACGNPRPQQVELTSSSELLTQNPRQAETAWRRQGRCEAHSQPQGKNHYGHSLRGLHAPSARISGILLHLPSAQRPWKKKRKQRTNFGTIR